MFRAIVSVVASVVIVPVRSAAMMAPSFELSLAIATTFGIRRRSSSDSQIIRPRIGTAATS